MPTFDLLAVYLQGDRIVSGRPVHDSPEIWVERMRKGPLTRRLTSADIKGPAGEKWTAQISNFQTAATATWVENARIRAAALAISGADDKADWQAANACELAVSAFLPQQKFVALREDVPRPALLLISADRDTFANRIVNTLSIGLATALFEGLKIRSQHLPLSPNPSKKGEAIFTALAYRSDGELESRHLLALSSFDPDPRYRELLTYFSEPFARSGNRFNASVGISGEKVGVTWQAFGGTAGVATLTRPGEEVDEAVLLLLTGLESAADEAAISAYEKHVADKGMSAAWSKAFRKISSEGRPLLVRFLTASTPSSSTGERVSWCMGAAFFRQKQVL